MLEAINGYLQVEPKQDGKIITTEGCEYTVVQSGFCAAVDNTGEENRFFETGDVILVEEDRILKLTGLGRELYFVRALDIVAVWSNDATGEVNNGFAQDDQNSASEPGQP